MLHVVRCWLFVVRCAVLFVLRLLFVVWCLLEVCCFGCCWLSFEVRGSLFVGCYSLCVVCCLLFDICRLLFVVRGLSIACSFVCCCSSYAVIGCRLLLVVWSVLFVV